MDLYAIAIILINSGLDPIKCWNTILFHTPKTPVHTTFNHKNYGYAKGKKTTQCFTTMSRERPAGFVGKLPVRDARNAR